MGRVWHHEMSVHPPSVWVGMTHSPVGAASTILPPSCWSIPLGIRPLPSSFLRTPPKTPAIAHTRGSTAGSGLFKSTAGVLIIHIKHALLANHPLKLS